MQLGRSVRYAFFRVRAFLDALLNANAWRQLGKRVFKRAVIIAIIGMAFAGITWTYSTQIFLWLLKPAGDSLSPLPGGQPVFTAPAEMFAVTVNLAFKGGMLAAFPVFIVSVYTLVSPWLSPSARKFIKIFTASVLLAFSAGVAFVYYILLPTSLEFLLGFGTDVAVAFISVTNYFELVLSLMFWVGIMFELPLLVYLLARFDLVSYRYLKWARLGIWFAAPMFATIITPSFDVYTWGLVLVPLVLLYELGLLLAWTARPEEGNYLWLKSIRNGYLWLWGLPCRIYWKLIGRPLGRLWRLIGKMFRKIWRS